MFGNKEAKDQKKLAKQEQKENKKALEAMVKTLREQVGKLHAAAHPMLLTFAATGVIKRAEQPLATAAGFDTEFKGAAIISVTETGVVIASGKGAQINQISLEYSDIDRVDTGTGVTMWTGSRKVEIANCIGKTAVKLRQILEERSATQASERTTDTAKVSPAEEIAKLAELHASGVLTNDEFSAAKARILGLN